MSSRVGAAGVNGSSKVGGRGSEDASEDDGNKEVCYSGLRPVRPRPRSADAAGEERPSGVEHLVRPALPGRKAHRKTCMRDSRTRWREGNLDREEERMSELVVSRERGKQRLRKTEVYEERQGRGNAEGSSSSNSDIQLSSTWETGEDSNLHRGQTCLHRVQTFTSNLNPHSSWPVMRSVPPALLQPQSESRASPLSSQRLSSRAAGGEQHLLRSSREPDPFWADVRREAGTSRSSHSHHSQAHGSELGEEEEQEEGDEEAEEEGDEVVEDGEEGGSGVMEVMSRSVTSATLPLVAFGERRLSKREKNRLKCLKRRQRRRERWRQSQLQESRQVSDSQS